MRFSCLAAFVVPALLVFPPVAAAQVVFHIETVDSTGDTGIGASIALDSQGRPHIAYIVRQNQDIRYAVKTGAAWTVQPGPLYADERTGVTLVLDSVDNPGIAHNGSYFRRVAGGWVEKYMGGFAPWFSTAAQDASGGLQGVTIWSWGSGDYEGYVSYTERIGDTWSDFVLDDGTFYPTNPHASIVIDKHGDPHVSVTPTAGDSVRYWHRKNGVWSRVVFTPGAWSSIALDEQDSPRISYYDIIARDLVLAFQYDGAWVTAPLDQTGDVGEYTSQKIRGGVSHVTYYTKSSGDLRYAVFNPSGGQTPVIQTVDSAGDVGAWSSLALDEQGRPHIAYRDAGNGHLKYATATVNVPVEKRTAGSVKWLYRR
jgi:hypothetical protein